MVVLSGLLIVALMSDKFSPARLKRIAIGAGVLIVVVSGLYFAHMRYGVAFTGKPLRGNWPQAEISGLLQDYWRRETNAAPLRVVAGDIWTAGLIGLHDRSPPSVLINGDYEAAPWITPEEVERYGALVVWSGSQPDALREFIAEMEPRSARIYARCRENPLPCIRTNATDAVFYPRFGSDYIPQSEIVIQVAIIPPGARAE